MKRIKVTESAADDFSVPKNATARAAAPAPPAADTDIDAEDDASEQPEPAVQPEPDSSEFPKSATDSRKLLAELENRPLRNHRDRNEVRAKEAVLSKLRSHIVRLESGLPVVSIQANEYAKAHGDNSGLLRTRLEARARVDLDIRALLEQYDQLTAEHDQLKQKLSKSGGK